MHRFKIIKEQGEIKYSFGDGQFKVYDAKEEIGDEPKASLEKIQKLETKTKYKVPQEVKPSLFRILLSPFLALWRSIRGTNKAAQEFLKETGCENFAGYLSLLQTTKKVLDEDLDSVVAIAERLQNILKVKSKETFADLAQFIRTQNPVSIPLGYYDEKGRFQPLMLILRKAGNGEKVQATLIGSDPKEPIRKSIWIPIRNEMYRRTTYR